MSRKPVSKKLRFEVFKRDGFACQYCGASPPDVELELDHIIPVAEGGLNIEANLITACFECNRGKSSVTLSKCPATIDMLIAKRRQAVDRYYRYMALHDEEVRLGKLAVNDVMSIFTSYFEGREFTDSFKESVFKFIKDIGIDEVSDSMRCACTKVHCDSSRALQYFCGICWNKIKQRS